MTTPVATLAGPGFTYYARWIGRCRTCKAVVKHEIAADAAKPGWSLAHRRNGYCATCDRVVVLNMVLGSHSDKHTCGARCTSAVGPNCECSCGGENHGCDS